MFDAGGGGGGGGGTWVGTAVSAAAAAAAELATRDGAAAATAIQCHTNRASDYYGLGVRLGIYFAWLQGYIANTALASEIGMALDTNTIFILTFSSPWPTTA